MATRHLERLRAQLETKEKDEAAEGAVEQESEDDSADGLAAPAFNPFDLLGDEDVRTPTSMPSRCLHPGNACHCTSAAPSCNC